MQRMKAIYGKLRWRSGSFFGWRATAWTVGVFHVVAEAAWAQQRAPLGDDESFLIRYAVLLGVVVVIGLAACLNPKRTHLS